MTEFLIHVRQNQQKIDSLKADQTITLKKLKQQIGITVNKEPSLFQLYLNGQILKSTSDQTTLQQLGLQNNSIVDVGEQQNKQNLSSLKFEYGMQVFMLDVSKLETVESVKSRIGNIIDCQISEFDLLIENNVFLQEGKSIKDYDIRNDTLLSVKRRLRMQGLGCSLKVKIRQAQSVVSSEQNQGQNIQNKSCSNEQNSPMYKKPRHIEKKNSCSSSLHHIQDPDEPRKNPMKHSDIQPYTMHKNQAQQQEQKQKIKQKIEDIKQSMSFGSLQDNRPQQTEVQVTNQDHSIFYRLYCPFGCKVNQLRSRLAKAERVNLENLQILQTQDQLLVEQLTQVGQPLRLKYKVKC